MLQSHFRHLASLHACINCFWRLHVDQITGETFGEVKPVASMHQRKAEMARHSDAFIALPGPTFPHPSPFAYPPLSGLISLHLRRPLGGYGTLEELLEVITWAQLGIHNKPVSPLH